MPESLKPAPLVVGQLAEWTKTGEPVVIKAIDGAAFTVVDEDGNEHGTTEFFLCWIPSLEQIAMNHEAHIATRLSVLKASRGPDGKEGSPKTIAVPPDLLDADWMA